MDIKEKTQRNDKRLSFEQTIRELDDFFIESNESQLYKFILATVEKPLIENVLIRTKGNKSKAAQILGINRNTLHSKIKKLGVKVE